MTLRRLDPVADEALFVQTHEWLDKAPRWRLESEEPWQREDWLAAAYDPTRIDVGVFDNDVLVADIRLDLRAVGLYEVHLEAAATTKAALVVEAGREVARWMFGNYGAQQVFAWIPRFNRPAATIIKAIGFNATGLMMWRGISHGKLIEWRHWVMEG